MTSADNHVDWAIEHDIPFVERFSESNQH